MKHLLIILTACLFSFTATAGSIDHKKDNSSSNPFSFDEGKAYQATEQLSELENYVNQNEGVTLSDLEASNHEVIQGLNLDDNSGIDALSPMSGPGGIPSFWWGFCLGAIGLLIVWLVTEDNDELKNALKGCAVAAGLYLVFYVVYVLIILGSI